MVPGHVRSRSRQLGFTLIEMVITLFILVIVLVGVLELFDLSAKVGRVQVDTADMQQTVRTAQYDMVRMLRMAGRGRVQSQSAQPSAVPWNWSENGVAVAVRNNVPANTYIDSPTSTNHLVLEDTDILTVRGVLTSPVYVANSASFTLGTTTNRNAADNGGTFTISNVTPQGGLRQDLTPIADAIRQGRPEALILVSSDGDTIRQIVRLDPAASVVTTVAGVDTQVTVQFRIGPTGNAYADAYWTLSDGQWNTALTKLAYVGIVEDYRYYVADEREIADDPNSAPRPRLLRARVYPGTAQPWGPGPAINDDANWSVPMADNIADLQVALGIENSAFTGVGTASTITDDGSAADEWLFNFPGDVPTAGGWRPPSGRLRFVRLNTTTFAERRDQKYEAPGYAADGDPPAAQVRVEDHSYNVPEYGKPLEMVPDRMYRRRTLQTIVDLRNL